MAVAVNADINKGPFSPVLYNSIVSSPKAKGPPEGRPFVDTRTGSPERVCRSKTPQNRQSRMNLTMTESGRNMSRLNIHGYQTLPQPVILNRGIAHV